jgi:hypothetical protein
LIGESNNIYAKDDQSNFFESNSKIWNVSDELSAHIQLELMNDKLDSGIQSLKTQSATKQASRLPIEAIKEESDDSEEEKKEHGKY